MVGSFPEEEDILDDLDDLMKLFIGMKDQREGRTEVSHREARDKNID